MTEKPSMTAAAPLLDVELVTLFPEMFDSFLRASLLGKAIGSGIVRVNRTNPRDFARGRHRQVDDSPYGGGPGMILRPEPVAAAIEAAETERGRAHRLLLSPAGRLFRSDAGAGTGRSRAGDADLRPLRGRGRAHRRSLRRRGRQHRRLRARRWRDRGRR